GMKPAGRWPAGWWVTPHSKWRWPIYPGPVYCRLAPGGCLEHEAERIAEMSTERPSLPRPRCRSLMGVRVLGTGSYVPDAVVTNDHLHQRFGFDSEWIRQRTGR